jgi:leucyl/phenylalanyl-tRNA--protein transferase
MLFLLDPNDPHAPFPDTSMAEREPEGLLAVGGDLSVPRLLNAYRRGIFPWYSEGDPILWWSPDPRTVLTPGEIRVSRSLRKTLRRRLFAVTIDRDFDSVIEACAQPRPGGDGTWLLPEMISAYQRLHRQGWAHSVEVWRAGELVGGLYGVALGRVFFGESMFSRVSDASKVALVHMCRSLQRWGFALIDCQVVTGHLLHMGARQIPREHFNSILQRWATEPCRPGLWDDDRRVFPDPASPLPRPGSCS